MQRLVMTFLLLVAVVVVLEGPQKPSIAQDNDSTPLRYNKRGDYAVGVISTTVTADRELDATVWYPAATDAVAAAEATTYRYPPLSITGIATQDARPDQSAAPYPLVVFSHGAGGFHLQSVWLTEHLASYGMIVAAIDHQGNTFRDGFGASNSGFEAFLRSFAQRPVDIAATIEHITALNEIDKILRGLVDTERLALMGHSFGGYTAFTASGVPLNFAQLNTYCSAEDTPAAFTQNICFLIEAQAVIAEVADVEPIPDADWPPLALVGADAVVAMAPYASPMLDTVALQGFDVPTLIAVGENDETTPAQRDAIPVFEQLDSPGNVLLLFENAPHGAFANDCETMGLASDLGGTCIKRNETIESVQAITRHVVTAFLLDILLGDTAAAQTLATTSFPAGVMLDYSE